MYYRDLPLSYNRLLIDYVTNPTYIFKASKLRQIQVSCLLNLRYEFKYAMAVTIIIFRYRLIYTFNAQAVNHLPLYLGFRSNYLKIRILSLQSPTNPLRISSLRIRVWDFAFYADEYLVQSLYIHYNQKGSPSMLCRSMLSSSVSCRH